MKLYYYFDRIDSLAEEIKLSSFGNNFLTFKLSDYHDWKRLEGEKFELSPYECCSLDKVISEGEEPHESNYSEEVKQKWYRFARNKLRSDYFNNTERIKELDLTDENGVAVRSKDKITTLSELKKLLLNIPVSALLDLSDINISEDCEDTNITADTTSAGLSLIRGRIIKTFPIIPANSPVRGRYASWKKLKDISNIVIGDGIEDFSSMFSGCASIEDASHIDLSHGVKFTNMFAYCDNLKKFPELKFRDDITIDASGIFCGTTYYNLEEIPDLKLTNKNLLYLGDGGIDYSLLKLKKIGNLDITGLAGVFTVGYGSGTNDTLEEIGDVTLRQEQPSTTSNSVDYILGDSSYSKPILNGLKKIGKIRTNFAFGTKWNMSNCEIEAIDIREQPLVTVSGYKCYPGFSIEGYVKKIGPINANCNLDLGYNYVQLVSLSMVKTLVALPAHYTYGLRQAPLTSNGFEHWYDDIDSTYLKKISNYPGAGVITKKDFDFSKHFDTMKKQFSTEIDITNEIIKVNPDYPYDFVLKSVDYSYINNTKITSDTNYNLAFDKKTQKDNCYITLKKEQTEDGEITRVYLLVEAEVSDDYVCSFETTVGPYVYEAEIEGNPFHGAVNLNFKGTFDFTITEDASVSFELDESDESNESDESATENTESTND